MQLKVLFLKHRLHGPMWRHLIKEGNLGRSCNLIKRKQSSILFHSQEQVDLVALIKNGDKREAVMTVRVRSARRQDMWKASVSLPQPTSQPRLLFRP